MYLSWLEIIAIAFAVPGLIGLFFALSWSIPVSLMIFDKHLDGLSAIAAILAIIINGVVLLLIGGAFFFFSWLGIFLAVGALGIISAGVVYKVLT